MNDRIMCRMRWPDIYGHPGGQKLWNGRRRAISEDGRYWEVKTGLFGRWRWLPVRGMVTSLQEVRRG